ncbi:MAG: calcium/sodium antiporter [Anaerolineales bacterium]|nr:calcium/sodium antiporter [Anaerolineales bacterium]MCB8953520.1 calcium/sodium antiporter [Ardenticatenales bacterium]
MFTAITSLLVIFLCVYFLSIITDEFFIESLDEIARHWQLPSNVAGASLMAMGSSMPELSIALLALVQRGGQHSDIGVGNIVGSAVFNILVITGLSALIRPARVSWQVVVRDCFVYSVSIGLLLFAFQDGVITIWEVLGFLGLYAIYIFILFQWGLIVPNGDADVIELVETEIEEQAQKTGVYYRVTASFGKALRRITGEPREHYVRTFLVSIAIIVGISALLVENAVIFAEAIHVHPVIIALTVLAAGSSVPDLIASLLVAREGRGEMAISNAVGSNIFDISIGLGLPWLLVILLQQRNITVGTDGLSQSVFILLVTVVILFIFLSTGRRLTRVEGAILVLIYIGYVLWMWLGG